jgi:hypothetical protein
VKRLEKRSLDFDFLERLAIGVAAAGGLVMAACISGLPSASCTALAETYSKAIGIFGSSAFSALLGLAVLIVAQQTFLRLRLSTGYRFLGYGFLLGAFYFFVAGAIASGGNLREATKQCFFGSDAELSARIHQQIKLAGPFDWAMFFNRVEWKN